MRLIALTLAAAFTLTACQAIQGLGRDIESGGKKIEEATKKDANKKDATDKEIMKKKDGSS